MQKKITLASQRHEVNTYSYWFVDQPSIGLVAVRAINEEIINNNHPPSESLENGSFFSDGNLIYGSDICKGT